MIVAALIASAVMYAGGIMRARTRLRMMHYTQTAAFVAALALTAAVLLGPFDALADASLAWHMVQHLTLSFIVAPLVLIGAPSRVALAALPTGCARKLAAVLRSAAVRYATAPVIAWLQFAAILYGVHFSPMYEAALENPMVHAFEHTLFLVSALIFWTPILAIAPTPHAPPHPVRILMLFLALPMSAFLGFILYVTRGVLYHHYAAFAGALADQADAGAVMWIAGGAPLLCALLWCVADWGVSERRLGLIADRLGPT